MSDYATIHIHAAAPPKPAFGATCNGCGVCCMVAPCPVSRFVLQHKTGSCPALVWREPEQLYRCGMMLTPARYCSWLPDSLTRPFVFFAKRWLALGIGCDADIDLDHLSSDE